MGKDGGFDRSIECRRSPTGGGGHCEISVFCVKLNRGSRERRGARKFRGIPRDHFPSSTPTFASPSRTPPSHACSTSASGAVALAYSRPSRVLKSGVFEWSAMGATRIRLYPFFSLCTSFDKNVTFVGAGHSLGAAIRVPKSASLHM